MSRAAISTVSNTTTRWRAGDAGIAGGKRIDGTRIRRTHAAGAAVLFVLLVVLGSVAKGERRHTEFYFENVYVSFFLASWSETIEALWRGALIEAAPSTPAAALN